MWRSSPDGSSSGVGGVLNPRPRGGGYPSRVPDMQRVRSSSIDAVGYDAERQELHVRFGSGRTYVYYGVAPEAHAGLLQAESKGRYLNDEIKRRYIARRLDRT